MDKQQARELLDSNRGWQLDTQKRAVRSMQFSRESRNQKDITESNVL